MSYQFEDDSALEELLNQQLDSRRRQQPASASRAAGSARQPATAAARPATSSLTTASRREQPEAPETQEPPRGKLASWLEGKKGPVESGRPAPASGPETLVEEPMTWRVSGPDSAAQSIQEPEFLLLDSLKESQLREMSKQTLVRLLVGQVEPQLRSLNRKLAEQAQLRDQNEALQRRLALEASRLESLEEKQAERLRVSELAWQQLNKQLEGRLESRELELRELSERQSKAMGELEAKHLEECARLAEGYQRRLEEERREFEEASRRREQFHKLELESKLKVNCDLKQLEVIFAEWNQLIQSTLGEFNGQHKQIEALLERQTVQMQSSNLELAKRTRSLAEEYGTFAEQTGRLSKLADQVELNLPRLMSLNDSNEELVKRISDKLAEFIPLNDELRAQEQQIGRLKDELRAEKERVAQERFQLGLDSNRLAYREERLNELELLNEQTSQRLADQLKLSDEREAQLRLARGQSESRSEELREQNYELHQNRKRLLEREEKLGQLEAQLREERRKLESGKSLDKEEARKLEALRDKARKELQQLRRLQKSLVCSVCLERLFKQTGGLNGVGECLPKERVDFNLDLANFNHYAELDGKQLAEESQYVQLLALAGV